MKKYEDPDKKLLKEQSKNTMNLVYGREYEDDESISEPYFYSYSTIYRNMDIDLNKKAKLEAKFPKMKAYFDKNYINTVGGEKDAKEVSNLPREVLLLNGQGGRCLWLLVCFGQILQGQIKILQEC